MDIALITSAIQSLLRRRAALVKMRVALNQSWAAEPLLKASSKSISSCLDRHEALIEKRILAAVTVEGVLHQVRRCCITRRQQVLGQKPRSLYTRGI